MDDNSRCSKSTLAGSRDQVSCTTSVQTTTAVPKIVQPLEANDDIDHNGQNEDAFAETWPLKDISAGERYDVVYVVVDQLTK